MQWFWPALRCTRGGRGGGAAAPAARIWGPPVPVPAAAMAAVHVTWTVLPPPLVSAAATSAQGKKYAVLCAPSGDLQAWRLSRPPQPKVVGGGVWGVPPQHRGGQPGALEGGGSRPPPPPPLHLQLCFTRTSACCLCVPPQLPSAFNRPIGAAGMHTHRLKALRRHAAAVGIPSIAASPVHQTTAPSTGGWVGITPLSEQ